MRALPVVLIGLLASLLLSSCRPAAPPASDASHIRIEPSRANDDPLRDKTPSGAVTAQEIGLDFYPGATVQTSSLVRDGRGVTAAARLMTRDGYAEVTQFYLDKYGRAAKIVKLDDEKGHSLALHWASPGATFTVDLKQDLAGKQTLIHLVRLTGKKDAPTGGKP